MPRRDLVKQIMKRKRDDARQRREDQALPPSSDLGSSSPANEDTTSDFFDGIAELDEILEDTNKQTDDSVCDCCGEEDLNLKTDAGNVTLEEAARAPLLMDAEETHEGTVSEVMDAADPNADPCSIAYWIKPEDREPKRVFESTPNGSEPNAFYDGVLGEEKPSNVYDAGTQQLNTGLDQGIMRSHGEEEKETPQLEGLHEGGATRGSEETGDGDEESRLHGSPDDTSDAE